MNQLVFITGATSGIGKACAQKFASAGCNVVITGRREDRLKQLKQEIESSCSSSVHYLCFDVQDKKAVFEAINGLSDEWKTPDILINNAGLALGRDPFDTASLDDWETMMNTNVNGLLYVSKALVPGMVARKKGHIINLGSVAGKEVYEKGNVYCASKFAVDAISRSMRIDLLPHNIKVTAIHPGAVETEFALVRFKGNQDTAKGVYKGFEPLTALDIANTVFYCASQPPNVCINELVITCTSQADALHFYRKE